MSQEHNADCGLRDAIRATLDQHADIGPGWGEGDAWVKYICTCGWESSEDHRDHLADVLASVTTPVSGTPGADQ